MGQTLCCHKKPHFHERYQKPFIKLATDRAGTKGEPLSLAVFKRYTTFLHETPDILERLSKELSAVCGAYYDKKPTDAHFQAMMRITRNLFHHYENFFRDSYYNHDAGVNERKEIVKESYFDLAYLLDDLETANCNSKFDLRIIESRIDDQKAIIAKAIANFARYHKRYIHSETYSLLKNLA